ncbi:MAG TPA: hypothetical protein VLM40_06555, partial [Gemmata sp.]|nr:hypothetical protein [Gemmata sp.]
DRDRLRQAVLEGLGWRLLRIWSGEWVRDREKQVRRILSAIEPAQAAPLSSAVEPDKVALIRTRTPRTKTQQYEAIEMVTDNVLLEAISVSLMEFGSMPADDLVAAVTRRLGFKRTGPKIRERVTDALNVRIAAGEMAMNDAGRIRLTKDS